MEHGNRTEGNVVKRDPKITRQSVSITDSSPEVFTYDYPSACDMPPSSLGEEQPAQDDSDEDDFVDDKSEHRKKYSCAVALGSWENAPPVVSSKLWMRRQLSSSSSAASSDSSLGSWHSIEAHPEKEAACEEVTLVPGLAN
eukprot:TRINITY_DN21641_c0_g1_i1.p1 TRINITY_DN21641_c0_g1~~TRINITY_DN21641_c0_g1_i1.p1  ORF type:complete len:141 (-),score=29.87 TRINITY_DN21641_c0_g1_i1:36-458(-)